MEEKSLHENVNLAPEVRFLLHNAIAPSTRRNYDSARQSYESLCTIQKYKPYPASIESITHWLAELMHKVKPATAKAYLNSIRSYHLENGISTAILNDPRIDLVLRGGKRVHGEGERRIRLPLTYDILLRITRETRNDFDGLNVKTALCVAFAGFLRSGEFTWETWDATSSAHHLARQHVEFINGSVNLTLPASKTDPFRNGVVIHLAQTTSPLCPVKALTRLFQEYPRQKSEPLFTRTIGSFNRVYIVDKIKELLLQAGISTFGFSGHSIRKGAAVTAAANGISKENIKLLGRWKSDAIDVYINELSQAEQSHKLLSLNSQLHTISNPTTTSQQTPPHHPYSTLP